MPWLREGCQDRMAGSAGFHTELRCTVNLTSNESCIQDLSSYCTVNTCQQYKADTVAVNFEGPREFDVHLTVHRDKFL